jgi:exopolysaccharide biosynthesis predicted pyruvyltransferase EpsI
MKMSAMFYCLYSNIFEEYVLLNANFVRHDVDLTLKNDAQRFEYAENTIKNYASAKLVVTSRIHCALPCLSMGTPVIFVNREGLSVGRFEGLLELLRVFKLKNDTFQTEDDMLLKAGKIGFNTKIENKTDFVEIKENLERMCDEFVKLDR